MALISRPISFSDSALPDRIYYNRLCIRNCGFFRKKWEFRQSIGIIMLLSAMSAVLAAGLGWLRAQGGDYNAVILERHRWSGVVVTVLTILTTLIYFKTYRGIILRRWVVVYRTGLFFLSPFTHGRWT